MNLFNRKRIPKEAHVAEKNVVQDVRAMQSRIADLEEEKNRLYGRLMRVREERLIETTRTDATESLLRERIKSAYRILLDRGSRRSHRDPAYALVRARIQELVANEDGPDEFERLSPYDFTALIMEYPEHKARLKDIAYEFDVLLSAEMEKDEESPPPEAPAQERPKAEA